MKIALINENSQASKNELIYNTLNNVAKKHGHAVVNYGMFNNDDTPLTYVQNGILAGILINSKAADFVVTGCGTGEGALVALNSFPNVICGYVVEPSDAYLFTQINAGNAISMPFAKGFGWGAELNLENVFEQLFKAPFGGGYPKERVVPEQRNKKILDSVKDITYRPMIDILKDLYNKDKELLIGAINRDSFKKYFFEDALDGEIKEFIKEILK